MLVVNDAFGRKVSLLNDTDGPLPKSSPSHPSTHPQTQTRCLSRTSTLNFSRKSSYSSQMSNCSESSYSTTSDTYDFPLYSPGPPPRHNNTTRPSPSPAPQLLRFDSTSSQQSIQTPSPTLSTYYQIDPMDQSKAFVGNLNDPYFRHPAAAGPYFTTPQQPLPGTSQSPSLFPPLDAAPAFALNDPYLPLQPPVQFAPYATDLIPTPPLKLASPAAAVAPASSAQDQNAAKPAKKKYPCPHAQKYSCADTFTTSGHAARHGKKHTGEKNIRCPVCDKAFTRKDNMKQHERTHRHNRDSANAASPAEIKRSKALSTESTESTETSVDMDMDGMSDDGRATIKAKPLGPRRPALSVTQQPLSPTSFHGRADIVMPVTLDSNEQLQQVAPELKLEPIGKNYTALGDAFSINRSQENIFAVSRPPMLDRTASAGSGFGSQDGEGESPGLDALAMAASMS